MRNSVFSSRVLRWADSSGRCSLPWQTNITPYRVWVSEIMLQQTRTETVIPYFEKFVQRFPEVRDLADASIDTILFYWSGLGYYARARNLHKAASIVASNGSLPNTVEELCNLPGIGRSTAGAILSIGYGIPAPILDGNVKRVLARYRGIEGWPGASKVNRQLWELSAEYTPQRRNRAYTQAIMDLGATVCTPRKPRCDCCPLAEDCFAFLYQRTNDLPTPRKRSPLPVKTCFMLVLRNEAGLFYLVKRPPTGIWGGLWVFPEFGSKRDTLKWCSNIGAEKLDWWPVERHTFSHYHLDYTPVTARYEGKAMRVEGAPPALWYDPATTQDIGLPKPIKHLVDKVQGNGATVVSREARSKNQP